jgi:hypothetical protein
LLRVVDERAGIELDPVALVRSVSADPHPGFVEERQKRQLSGPDGELRSPLDLLELKDVAQGAQRLFVGAPGYAWQVAALDVGSGTERKVVLSVGGTLRLRLSMVPDPGTRLRVRGEVVGPVLDTELPALDALELDGLTPDNYTVEVDASPERGGVRLADGQVAVPQGSTTNLTLFLGSTIRRAGRSSWSCRRPGSSGPRATCSPMSCCWPAGPY